MAVVAALREGKVKTVHVELAEHRSGLRASARLRFPGHGADRARPNIAQRDAGPVSRRSDDLAQHRGNLRQPSIRILALIEFAWTAAILVLERTDLQGWTAALIRKMMFIGSVLRPTEFRCGLDSADHQQLSNHWPNSLRSWVSGADGHPRQGAEHHRQSV